jgi:FkbM family methyltransferase
MAKLPALANAGRFSRLGADARSKAMLFCLALLNQLGHHRKVARQLASRCLTSLNGSSERLDFAIRLCGRTFPIAARVGDGADYQSIWECLSDSMYHRPARPIRHVFDGGGNIGLFSLAAAALASVDDIVIVEPDPENFAILQQNLAAFPKARKLRLALSATDGNNKFVRISSNGGHLVRADGEDSAHDIYDVPTRRISALFPPEWSLADTWLKLDIEGAEYEVIPELLGHGLKPGFISMEIHDYLHGGENLVERLRAVGYTVVIEGSGTTGDICRQISAQLPCDPLSR